MIDDRSLDGWCGTRAEHEMSNYEVRDHYESLITNGDLIRKADLRKWLDKCMDAADIVLQFSDNKAKVEGIIDAYKAVKAHIQG